MINIREVARLAGVSPATVSRVINGTAKVSEEKRARVLSAIAETDFVPNEVARTLFKRSSKTIGLIIPSIRNPFFTELAARIDELAESGAITYISTTWAMTWSRSGKRCSSWRPSMPTG